MAAKDLQGPVDELLEAFGVLSTKNYDAVVLAIKSALESKGARARVVEMRYGRLVLAADPVTARLLRFDTQRLLKAVEDVVPGVVSELQVRSER